jgi:hypothetical protein
MYGQNPFLKYDPVNIEKIKRKGRYAGIEQNILRFPQGP